MFTRPTAEVFLPAIFGHAVRGGWILRNPRGKPAPLSRFQSPALIAPPVRALRKRDVQIFTSLRRAPGGASRQHVILLFYFKRLMKSPLRPALACGCALRHCLAHYF
ncbi:hypothetical protein EVAR_10077_1 [Eumeta japonica]|uniref:Uncharacterized protein n=1 Tax=Eumeta variegata TaxID=151549 RepID=A0A4C1TRB0_EUMVA|nr:hypothetical protein EVAR_10077_1 [Eumeta japonica]